MVAFSYYSVEKPICLARSTVGLQHHKQCMCQCICQECSLFFKHPVITKSKTFPDCCWGKIVIILNQAHTLGLIKSPQPHNKHSAFWGDLIRCGQQQSTCFHKILTTMFALCGTLTCFHELLRVHFTAFLAKNNRC